MKRGRAVQTAALLLLGASSLLLEIRAATAAEAFNVRQVGRINYAPWAVAADERCAYLGGYLGFHIYDVSNPASPVYRSWFRVDGLSRGPQYKDGLFYGEGTTGIQVRNGLAYAADAGYGLQIVDVTNPSSPALRGAYDTPRTAFDVSLSGNLAFVADVGSLQVVDVSNPSSPRLRGSVPMSAAADVWAEGNIAVVGDGTLRVVDVTNPSSPVLRSSWGSPAPYPMGIFNVSVSNGTAYCSETTGTETSPSDRLVAIDVRNPNRPQLLVSTPWATGGGGATFICGSYLYASRAGGVQIYDISNPSSFVLRGFYPYGGRIFVRPDPRYGNLVYVGGGAGPGYTLILQFPATATAADRRWNLYR